MNILSLKYHCIAKQTLWLSTCIFSGQLLYSINWRDKLTLDSSVPMYDVWGVHVLL